MKARRVFLPERHLELALGGKGARAGGPEQATLRRSFASGMVRDKSVACRMKLGDSMDEAPLVRRSGRWVSRKMRGLKAGATCSKADQWGENKESCATSFSHTYISASAKRPLSSIDTPSSKFQVPTVSTCGFRHSDAERMYQNYSV